MTRHPRRPQACLRIEPRKQTFSVFTTLSASFNSSCYLCFYISHAVRPVAKNRNWGKPQLSISISAVMPTVPTSQWEDRGHLKRGTVNLQIIYQMDNIRPILGRFTLLRFHFYLLLWISGTRSHCYALHKNGESSIRHCGFILIRTIFFCNIY